MPLRTTIFNLIVLFVFDILAGTVETSKLKFTDNDNLLVCHFISIFIHWAGSQPYEW